MKTNKNLTRYFLLFCMVLNSLVIYAQRTCHTDALLEEQIKQNPSLKIELERKEEQLQRMIRMEGFDLDRAGVLTIPVVFHIIYNTDAQNISDAQIQSQMEVLNEDFRMLNSDVVNVPDEFSDLVADSKIEFQLANIAPDGSETTGIIRYHTNKSSFNMGIDAEIKAHGYWDSDYYLNVWVCNLSDYLGWATFPGTADEGKDGVVVGHKFIGKAPHNPFPGKYNLGRTLTHEVGHWLNLSHIWGRAGCNNDDGVADTPKQDDEYYGVPAHPQASCGSNDMFMNYMDYVNDKAMVMFSKGQAARMHAAIKISRPKLGQTPGYCAETLTIDEAPFDDLDSITYSASQYIVSNTTFSHGKVSMQAADYVILQPGFEAKSAVDFTAHIDECNSEPLAMIQGQRTGEEMQTEVEEARENIHLFGMKAYPNPFQQQMNIEYQLDKDASIRLYVRNTLGQIVKIVYQGKQSAGQHRTQLQAGELAVGVYYLTLETPNERKVEKIIAAGGNRR